MTFGLENPLASCFWSAAKTGTSKDLRDNWCVGYSDTYTVGIWVGNDSGEPMWNISGISGAAPSWSEIMAYPHQHRTSRAPRVPAGVVRRGDWFIRGTEQPESLVVSRTPDPVLGKISYPVMGMLLAIRSGYPGRSTTGVYRD